MTYTIVCGDVDVRSHGYGFVGDVEVAHRHTFEGGGLHYVKWSLSLPPGYTHPSLRAGALVQVLRGPVSVGWAMLADPDRESGEFVADGIVRRAEHFPAATSSPRTAVQAALVLGLEWAGVGVLPTDVVLAADGASPPTTLAEMLTLYATTNGLRWGVDAHRVPYMVPDPALATVSVTHDVPVMATSDGDVVNRVRVRYVSQVTNGDPTGWAYADAVRDDGRPARWRIEDITGVGLTSASAAGTFAARVLASYAPNPAFTESVETAYGQVCSTGGVPIDLWAAGLEVCGQRVVQYGVLDSDAAPAYGQTLEWVVGATVHRPGERTVVVSPVDRASRTVAEFFQDRAAVKLRKRAGLDD